GGCPLGWCRNGRSGDRGGILRIGGLMSYPIIAPVNGRRTSGFGPRNTNIPGATTNHRGIDIGANPRGSKPAVRSPVSGKVIAVQRTSINARGQYVIVRGPDASFLVQHMERIPTKIVKNKKVKIGQILGYMSNTAKGVNIAIHLHFEVHKHPKGRTLSVSEILSSAYAVDPEKFYPEHKQPKPWERPGEGIAMTTKHKSRHVDLKCYEEDRK